MKEPYRLLMLNAFDSRLDNFQREFQRRGKKVDHFFCRGPKDLCAQTRNFTRAVDVCDAVISGLANFPWQIPWLLKAKSMGKPVLLDCPVDITVAPYAVSWRKEKMLGWIARRADGFLTLKSRKYLIEKFRLDPAKVLCVENCPDLPRIADGCKAQPAFFFPPGSVKICYSGVATWQAPERFIPIFKMLCQKIPSAVWLIISFLDTPMISKIRKEAQAAGILEKIIFQPVIKPYENFIATADQCDLWVSHLDNDSLLGRLELRTELLEMGILGKTITAVSTPAMEAHGFVDGRHFIKIDDKDPAASAEKIAAALKNPTEFYQIGRNLRGHVLSHFSLADSMDRLFDFLESKKIPAAHEN